MVNFFVLALFTMTAACGVIWLLERYVWKPARLRAALALHEDLGDKVSVIAQQPVMVSMVCITFPILLYVFLVRSFFFEIYKIPTESMLPTYKVGSSVLIDKLIYSVNEPLFHRMIFEREAPQRDEVAVFMLPDNPGINYIKRVVGVPGDRITYKNKVLTVEPLADGDAATYEVKIEEGKSDRIDSFYIQEGMNKGEWLVPDGHFFVMGDNRDDSQDSRFWGFVPRENFVGKVIADW